MKLLMLMDLLGFGEFFGLGFGFGGDGLRRACFLSHWSSVFDLLGIGLASLVLGHLAWYWPLARCAAWLVYLVYMALLCIAGTYS